ncbi:MAG: nucleotide sugar dehydrogenase [Candidatus Sericytochromatia bacterium]
MSAHHTVLDLLVERFQQRQATVAVIGLGYVGLPLLRAFYAAGFSVIGLDPNRAKLADLQQGISYIQDVPQAAIAEMASNPERVRYSADTAVLTEADALVICVPTPLHKSKEPDLSFIVSAAEGIAPHLREGQLVVLESTTYPGTTEELLQPRFEQRGWTVGHDVFLAFSPERIDPGNPHFGVTDIPKVVGGVTPACLTAASALYATIMQRVHPVSSARVAETAKILENTFRSVNIALVNEFAGICRALGIDVWEVIEAAATKPFGFMKFTPGPGIGGHCIPLDPHYLIWKARLQGFEPRFMALADQINAGMPAMVVQLVMEALNEVGRALKGTRVLVLGVTYKADIDDARESPAGQIIPLLRLKGADVSYHDPFVPRYVLEDGEMQSLPLTQAVLEEHPLVLILSAHTQIDYGLVATAAQQVVDTRNVMRGHTGPARVYSL